MYMWSFRCNDFMYRTTHSIESEMTVDLRDQAARTKAKHNDPVDSLNTTVPVLKKPPEFIHRQGSSI